MTRPELAAAIRALREDEKLELLSELWDSIDDSTSMPEWHKEELDKRLASVDPASFVTWENLKARLLGSK